MIAKVAIERLARMVFHHFATKKSLFSGFPRGFVANEIFNLQTTKKIYCKKSPVYGASERFYCKIKKMKCRNIALACYPLAIPPLV
tara:strand:- start:1331 stop:1588 length:258 start_codon:yes stop_codon:yes gene_type:complete